MTKSTLARFTASYLLDARPDQLDLRDREFQPGLQHLPANFPALADWQSFLPRYLQQNMVLDQGQNGACTGFALAALIQYSRARLSGEFELVSPRMLYHLARFYDEFPGENYQGSSCRGVLKAWHRHGVCRREFWPYTLSSTGQVADYEAPQGDWANDALTRRLGVYYRVNQRAITDIQAALCQAGVVLASAHIHKGWNQVASPSSASRQLDNWNQLPRIPGHTKSLGGHAFAILGYTAHGFIIQNSWGSAWGWLGLAILPYEDWLSHAIDTWVFSLAPAKAPEPSVQKTPNFFSLGLSGPGYQRKKSLTSSSLPAISEDAASQFLLINRRDGQLQQLLLQYRDASAAAQQVICDLPDYWFQHFALAQTELRLALIFLEGLDDQANLLTRVQKLSPEFLEAGIYPLFITQDNTLSSQLQQQFMQTLSQTHPAHSRAQIQNLQLKQLQMSHLPALWLELQHSANLAQQTRPGHSLYELSLKLRLLQKKHPGRGLSLHVIGQGSGVYLMQRWLDLQSTTPLKIRSVQLLAPSCHFDFAAMHWPDFSKLTRKPSCDWQLYVCDQRTEQQQYLATAYDGKLSQVFTHGLELSNGQFYTAWFSEWQARDKLFFAAQSINTGVTPAWFKKAWLALQDIQKQRQHQRNAQSGIHLVSVKQKHHLADLICQPEIWQTLLKQIQLKL